MCRWAWPLHSSVAISPDSHEDLSPPGFYHSKLHNLTVLIRVLWGNRAHRMNLSLSLSYRYMHERAIYISESLIYMSDKWVYVYIYIHTYDPYDLLE